MAKVISKCPSCGGALKIAVLRCSDCGMELHNDFQRGPFDSLTAGQTEFLISFLRQRGKMSSLQVLKLVDNIAQAEKEEELVDMSDWFIPKDSNKASDIIKKMLIENGGRAIVHTAQGLPREIRVAPDGISFLCNELPIKPPYRYEVFDKIVDLLISQGGRAKKGNGRHKLGDPDCNETTVVGFIGYNYFHYETGKSVPDPVFMLAAVLEWAGIASNERGELVLTTNYQEKLRAATEGR